MQINYSFKSNYIRANTIFKKILYESLALKLDVSLSMMDVAMRSFMFCRSGIKIYSCDFLLNLNQIAILLDLNMKTTTLIVLWCRLMGQKKYCLKGLKLFS